MKTRFFSQKIAPEVHRVVQHSFFMHGLKHFIVANSIPKVRLSNHEQDHHLIAALDDVCTELNTQGHKIQRPELVVAEADGLCAHMLSGGYPEVLIISDQFVRDNSIEHTKQTIRHEIRHQIQTKARTLELNRREWSGGPKPEWAAILEDFPPKNLAQHTEFDSDEFTLTQGGLNTAVETLARIYTRERDIQTVTSKLKPFLEEVIASRTTEHLPPEYSRFFLPPETVRPPTLESDLHPSYLKRIGRLMHVANDVPGRKNR